MIKTKFVHVALTCKDMRVIIDFYSKYFGFKVARRVPLGPDKEIVFIRNDEGVYFELFSEEMKSPLEPFTDDGPHWQGLRHVAFQVDSLKDKLAELGDAAPITLGPLAFDAFIPGWHTAWVKDPEGNIIEISEGYKD